MSKKHRNKVGIHDSMKQFSNNPTLHSGKICYHPYLVSMLLADLLFLYHHCIFNVCYFKFLFMSLLSSRCMLELKFAIYHRTASLLSQASYKNQWTRPGFLQTLPAHQQYF